MGMAQAFRPEGTPPPASDFNEPSQGRTNFLNARRARETILRRNDRGDGGAGYEDIAPDAADAWVREQITGRLSRARRGSNQSALGQAFNASEPLFGESLMGG